MEEVVDCAGGEQACASEAEEYSLAPRLQEPAMKPSGATDLGAEVLVQRLINLATRIAPVLLSMRPSDEGVEREAGTLPGNRHAVAGERRNEGGMIA